MSNDLACLIHTVPPEPVTMPGHTVGIQYSILERLKNIYHVFTMKNGE